MTFFSVSTWSLHRLLGPMHKIVWDEERNMHLTEIQQQDHVIQLLELPKILAEKGFSALEVCYFHFHRTDQPYLDCFKKACEEANIRIYTLLMDYGDLSSPDENRVQADIQLIKKWIDIAAIIGAERVRIIGSEAEPTNREALKRMSKHLNELVSYAEEQGVKILTENFQSLLSTSENCLYLVQQSEGKVRLISDFGNIKGPEKYNELAKMIPFSDSVHAKPHFDENGFPDVEEFQQCLDLLKEADYDGPIVIIYDGPGDMLEGVERVKKIIENYL